MQWLYHLHPDHPPIPHKVFSVITGNPVQDRQDTTSPCCPSPHSPSLPLLLRPPLLRRHLFCSRTLNCVRAFATRTLGFAHVFDTTFAWEIVLCEHVRKFFKQKEREATSGSGSGALPMRSSACPG